MGDDGNQRPGAIQVQYNEEEEAHYTFSISGNNIEEKRLIEEKGAFILICLICHNIYSTLR